MEIPAAMIEKYVQHRFQDYSECLNAAQKKESEPIERIGHKIKGNATTFGFDQLGEIAELMESAAQQEDWEAINLCIQRFGSYLSRIQ